MIRHGADRIYVSYGITSTVPFTDSLHDLGLRDADIESVRGILGPKPEAMDSNFS